MSTDGSMVNAFVEGRAALRPEEAELVARRRRLLGPAYRLFYDRPLHLVRGEGAWLYDAQGRRYLDAYNNVASVGHGHPRVVEAMARQAATLATHTRYLHEAVLAYAERLLATMPPAIGHLMFTCTGSEANDLAVRIARAYTGGTGVIVTETAYHGVTQAVAEFSPSLGPGVPLGPHVRTVPAPDLWRSPTGDVAAEFAAAVEAAIADLRRNGIRPALFICDALFTSDGVFADPPGLLRGAVEAARAAGALYVADEVQCGFGRTGEGMWGFARHGVVPDIVTMGKPMGNGYPVAGVALRPEVIEEFGRAARYFNTFGGNAVAAAVAQAVLDVIESEGLIENARAVGARLRDGLRGLAQDHPSLGEVRGAGLFLGVDIVRDRDPARPDAAAAARIVNALRDAGVLISACARAGNVLKIRPPLILSVQQADLLIDRLSEVLRTAA